MVIIQGVVMIIELTPRQKEDQAAFRAFVNQEIVPYASQFDQEECIPPDLVEKLVRIGYWGAILPVECGGSGMDMLTYGLLTEEIGRGCASIRNLLAIQGMVAVAILKWGSASQKDRLIPGFRADGTGCGQRRPQCADYGDAFRYNICTERAQEMDQLWTKSRRFPDLCSM
jgi:alkylation response protein AidB-like acyl-CoA dehydrogenase